MSGAQHPALRRDGFWIAGDDVSGPAGTHQRGPMWVEHLHAEEDSERPAVIFVHGGGGQGTDWLVTPDGRSGWAPRFAVAGYDTYVVDRVGHGRSPHHPDVLGAVGGQMPAEASGSVFAPAGAAAVHTQWPWSREPDGAELRQLVASSGFLLEDFALAQELDAARLVALLERVGPAVVVTHSAGAPAGWLAASRSEKVRGVIAIEPMGPPYAEVPGLGALSEGLTSVPLAARGLTGVPVVVITGSASPFAGAADAVVSHLGGLGAAARHLPLAERGITGNGHGLIFEANSDETAQVALTVVGEM